MPIGEPSWNTAARFDALSVRLETASAPELKSMLTVSGLTAPLVRVIEKLWLVALVKRPVASKVTSPRPMRRETASLSFDSATNCQVVPPEALVCCSVKVRSMVSGVPSES